MNQLTYFAQINENNVVIHVAVTTPEFMNQNPDRYIGTWVETFIDNPAKTYAGVGYIYDEDLSDFVAPENPNVPLP
jgi:hypothetical protein